MLCFAARFGSTRALKALLAGSAGAEDPDVRATPRWGSSRWFRGGRNGDVKGTRGADVHVADSVGWTPLHCAAREGHMDCVTALLAAGARLDALTSCGRTPLAVAQRFKPTHTELHEMLYSATPRTLPGTMCDHCGAPAEAVAAALAEAQAQLEVRARELDTARNAVAEEERRSAADADFNLKAAVWRLRDALAAALGREAALEARLADAERGVEAAQAAAAASEEARVADAAAAAEVVRTLESTLAARHAQLKAQKEASAAAAAAAAAAEAPNTLSAAAERLQWRAALLQAALEEERAAHCEAEAELRDRLLAAQAATAAASASPRSPYDVATDAERMAGLQLALEKLTAALAGEIERSQGLEASLRAERLRSVRPEK